jgi:hypothetical protein
VNVISKRAPTIQFVRAAYPVGMVSTIFQSLGQRTISMCSPRRSADEHDALVGRLLLSFAELQSFRKCHGTSLRSISDEAQPDIPRSVVTTKTTSPLLHIITVTVIDPREATPFYR